MVRAVADTMTEEEFKLKSLDGEGWVKLRRLTYGQKLHRRSMVSKMRIETSGKKSKDFQGEMDLINEKATQYDFANCIIDHNLEDEAGKKLNFSSIADIQRLDPRVGEEIDTLIGELNNFEENEEDFSSGSDGV
jgi:hypothetical protein